MQRYTAETASVWRNGAQMVGEPRGCKFMGADSSWLSCPWCLEPCLPHRGKTWLNEWYAFYLVAIPVSRPLLASTWGLKKHLNSFTLFLFQTGRSDAGKLWIQDLIVLYSPTPISSHQWALTCSGLPLHCMTPFPLHSFKNFFLKEFKIKVFLIVVRTIT